ncbi:MAG: tetratricopeptide repeat-containing serine protease family protein [Synechococcales bacterium]|nr:tetratricopeptide repeat-containing serine protease family protein [Synechococcales bacterium]
MLRPISPITILGCSAIVASAQIAMVQPSLAQSLDRIQQTAQQITVKIEAERPSSGVLISRKGDPAQGYLYTILTTRHGVRVEDRYTILTPDGQRHPVEWRSIQPLPTLDLAIVQFKSDRHYHIAQLAPYTPKPGQPLLLAGWPQPPSPPLPPPLTLTLGSTLPSDQAIPWAIDPLSQGYRLFYTNLAQAGMSGGAILDTAGQVVGIHGRSEGEELQKNQGQLVRLRLGYSSGISIRTLLQHQPRLGLQLGWQTSNQLPQKLTPADQNIAQQWTKALIEPPPEPATAIDWANYANTLYRLGRLPEALAALDRALALDFSAAPLWYAQGTLLHSLGRAQEAINSFDRASQLQPQLSRAWQGKAIALLSLNRPVEAVGALDQALQVNPQNYVAYYLRAKVLSQRLNQPQAALADCDRALQLQPDFPEVWLLKSQVLQKLGRHQEAKKAIEAAQQ